MSEYTVSVVLPCLNEERGLGLCLEKIKRVFESGNISGEIVVADNGSTDRSVQIATGMGARVVHEKVQGYGAAYLCGIAHAKGDYIIIGDSDNTYDFDDIPRFLKALDEGYDFVIGSRFQGRIHSGAMPWANRYIGNPILSGMTRLFFRTRLSDIHCGMRGFSKRAYDAMKLHTLGMEFATEMVVSAIMNDLKIREIPIEYYAREGESKLQALRDAWRHVRFMLLYCPTWLYFIPGISGFLLGAVALLLLLPGPFFFLGRFWDVHVMIFAAVLCILSYQVFHLGIYAHTFAIEQGFLKRDAVNLVFQRYFNLERGLVAGFLIFCVGLAINGFIFFEWFSNRFGSLYRIRESIFAMTLLVIGLQTVFSSFFISLLSLRKR